jgi:very-short-patch-repair endonuclease
MKKDQVNNFPQLMENRRQLRNNPTSAEAELWKELRGSQLQGRKFRRQHSVGPYILDFYCPAEHLAVEVDGAEHYTAEGAANDAERTAFLETHQIQVIRFENEEVLRDLDMILEKIRQCFSSP